MDLTSIYNAGKDFGTRFAANLAKAPAGVFGEGTPTSALYHPIQSAGQFAEGVGNSLAGSAQGIMQGGIDLAHAVMPGPNMAERAGMVAGAGVKAAGNALWALPSAGFNGLQNITGLKPVGQALNAFPQFMGDQANKLYGPGGAYQQAINQIPAGPFKNFSQATEDFGKNAAPPTMTMAAQLAEMGVLGKLLVKASKAHENLQQSIKDLPPELQPGQGDASGLVRSDQYHPVPDQPYITDPSKSLSAYGLPPTPEAGQGDLVGQGYRVSGPNMSPNYQGKVMPQGTNSLSNIRSLLKKK